MNNNNKFILFGNEDENVVDESVNNNIVNEEPVVESTNINQEEVNKDNYEEDSYMEEVENSFEVNSNIQGMINKILNIDNLRPVQVDLGLPKTKEQLEQEELQKKLEEERQNQLRFNNEINEIVNAKVEDSQFKSDLLDRIKEEEQATNTISMMGRYGEDFTAKTFVTNPAIGRDEEIKQLVLTLLTPEKSAILIGKPGIGKTSIVEGLAYRLQRNNVPDALKEYSIINIKTPSLLGVMPNGETKLQTLVEELKKCDKVILFIDEIHMLMGSNDDSALDFANMFKEGLGRGQIKVIGATTTDEYERYILRDKAFVRRFQAIEVLEPNREHTIKILMGTLPKIEKETSAKMKYSSFIQSEIMGFIVDITSEFKRIYGIGSRYPDICLTLLKEAFSQCIFDNRSEVTIFDVRNAIQNSKNIYPDVIRKELPNFDLKFKDIINEERGIGI